MKNILFISFLTIFAIAACTSKKKASSISFLSPEAGRVNLGDTIKLQLDIPEDKVTDSIVYFVNDKLINKSIGNEPVYFDSSDLSFGNQLLNAKHYENGEVSESNVMIMIVPDQSPAQYSFSVVNSYPHDEGAYTQGLEFQNGVLY